MSGFARGISKAALQKAGLKLEAGDTGSELEGELLQKLQWAGITTPIREAKLIPGRQFRVDFYWPAARLVVEVDGGTFSGGRHTRGVGYATDCLKLNTLTLLGYRVLRVTGQHISSGEALAWIEQGLSDSDKGGK
jgi:very-short-patch-repair endonuclease